MANDFTTVIPKLLAQGLLALRQQAIMPRLVNRAYDTLAGERGSTIDVPIPSAVTVAAVSPAATPPSTASQTPTKAAISLSEWNEAAFYLSDKDMQEVMVGTIPMQASEAIKAIANQIDSDILALYKSVYSFVGTPASTPFGSNLDAYLAARKVLALRLSPMDPRFVVLDPAAEANALSLRAFQDASFRGDTGGIINGQIGNKLGALWAMDQNIPYHTASSDLVGAVNETGGVAAGTKTIAVDGFSAPANEGDVFTIDDQFESDGVTLRTFVAAAGCTTTSLVFEPGLATAFPTADGNQVVTIKGSHVVNLAFHRDAFALAMRPFAGADPLGIGLFQSAVDPVSGLVLRLEVTREFKRTRFSYDVLYGVKCVRPELACRIAG